MVIFLFLFMFLFLSLLFLWRNKKTTAFKNLIGGGKCQNEIYPFSLWGFLLTDVRFENSGKCKTFPVMADILVLQGLTEIIPQGQQTLI